MAEFPAAAVVSVKGHAADDQHAAHAALQRQIGHILQIVADVPFGEPAAAGVVVHIGRVRDLPHPFRERYIFNVQRRREYHPVAGGRNNGGHRDPHAQELFPGQSVLIQKLLQRRGKLPGLRQHLRRLSFAGDLPIRQLPEPQIHRRKPDQFRRNGDAHGKTRLCRDVQPHGFSASRGTGRAGIADQPLLHQLRQILIQRRHADLAFAGQSLPGAGPFRFIQASVDPVSDGPVLLPGWNVKHVDASSRIPLYHCFSRRQPISRVFRQLWQKYFIKHFSCFRHFKQICAIV